MAAHAQTHGELAVENIIRQVRHQDLKAYRSSKSKPQVKGIKYSLDSNPDQK